MMFTMLSLILGLATASEVVPHRLTYCVALLTDPTFADVGRRILPDAEEPEPLPTRRVPYPSHIQNRETYDRMVRMIEHLGLRARSLTFSREFIGAKDIATYLDAVIRRAQALQSGVDEDSTLAVWDETTKGNFRRNSLTAGLYLVNVLAFSKLALNHPDHLEITIPLSAAVLIGLAYSTRSSLLKFCTYVRALVAKNPRTVLRANDANYGAGEILAALRFFEAEAAENREGNFDGPRLGWIVDGQVAGLIIDPAGSDDVPAARENYDRLVVAALREVFRNPPSPVSDYRVLDVRLRLFRHPKTEVFHLRVHASILNPSFEDGARRPPKIDDAAPAEREWGAAIPQGI